MRRLSFWLMGVARRFFLCFLTFAFHLNLNAKFSIQRNSTNCCVVCSLSLSPSLLRSFSFICTFRQVFKRNYQMLHHGACSQTVTARIRLHFLLALLAKPISCLWKEGSAGRRQRRGHILPNGHEIKNVLLQIRLQCPLWQCCNCNAWRQRGEFCWINTKSWRWTG